MKTPPNSLPGLAGLCPFCRSSRVRVHHSEDRQAYVVCDGCGANGPSVNVSELAPGESSRETAILRWNTRPTTNTDLDSVAELRKRIEASARMVLCTVQCPVCLSVHNFEADTDKAPGTIVLPNHVTQAAPDSEMEWAESRSDPALCLGSEQLVRVVTTSTP